MKQVDFSWNRPMQRENALSMASDGTLTLQVKNNIGQQTEIHGLKVSEEDKNNYCNQTEQPGIL